MRWLIHPLRRCLDFAGRAPRREFWPFALVAAIGLLVTGVLVPPLAALLALAIFLPLFAVAVRRLHDVGLRGVWLLPLVILPAAMLLVLVLGSSVFTLIAVAVVDRTASENDIRNAFIAAETAMAWMLGLWTAMAIVAWCWRGRDGPNAFGDDPRPVPVGESNGLVQVAAWGGQDWKRHPAEVARTRRERL